MLIVPVSRDVPLVGSYDVVGRHRKDLDHRTANQGSFVRATREVDDQGAVAHACHGTRQDGLPVVACPGQAHQFSQSWDHALHHLLGRIGHAVMNREADPAKGKDEVDEIPVRPEPQLRAQDRFLVGNSLIVDFDKRALLELLADDRQGAVVVAPTGFRIVEGKNGSTNHGTDGSAAPIDVLLEAPHSRLGGRWHQNAASLLGVFPRATVP